MPGRSLDDFEVGQFVGLTNKRWEEIDNKTASRVVNVVGFDGEFVKVNGKGFLGSGFWPHNLYTAEETEEILYHCSYCGKEGHNRRTCPELGISLEVKEEKVKYKYGLQVGYEDLRIGDLIKIKNIGSSVSTKKYEEGLYEVLSPGRNTLTRTIEGPGGFGHEWNFNTDNWKFYEALPIEAEEKVKHLPLWELIETVLPVSRLTLLYGPPGTGKTTAANFLGNPKEVFNLTLTEETPAAELRGHFIPKGGEFIWMDGPALAAFKVGARLVLNEIDKASGDALTFCHALLDDPGISKITLPTTNEKGEPVSLTPHENFHVVATMNGEPEDLPEALRDRFAVRIHVDKVHPNAIANLPKELRKIASKGISKDGERSVSIRGWNAFVQLRAIVGEANAAKAVFGARSETILNTIKIDSMEKEKK